MPSKPKGKEIKAFMHNTEQFTICTQGKPNEQLFHRQVAIQLPKRC